MGRSNALLGFREFSCKALFVALCLFGASGTSAKSSGSEAPYVPEAQALERSVADMREGRYNDAVRNCSKILKINPMSAGAYACRGSAYRLTGRHELAFLDFEKALGLNPNLVEVYNERGLAYKETGKYDNATRDFARALEINPSFVPALSNLAAIAADRGDVAKAISYVDSAIKIVPRVPDGYEFRARLYGRTGQLKEACADARKACDLGLCRLFDEVKKTGQCELEGTGATVP